MELVLNIEDIHKLIIKSTYGERYQLVPLEESDPFGEYLTRVEVRRRYKIGHDKLNRWVDEGLVFIRDGTRELFDRRDIDIFMETKKVGK